MRALIGNVEAEAEAEGGGKKSNAEEKRQMALGDGRFVSAVHNGSKRLESRAIAECNGKWLSANGNWVGRAVRGWDNSYSTRKERSACC